ncbi:hypothetical protein NHX12_021155 [Muraenolepis orangiensis]|uniref:Uncharacterized protein n=1 Tax=Muraenolepis orangiensis TaxID=630683 RepID=A0A9Q0IU80_9TELE|nr:hypothetical protein NHX12_021155 [Muraenolepis orangiensis]
MADSVVEVCHSFGLPVWMSPLIHAAGRMKSDPGRRRKAYRLLQRRLVFHKVGVKEEGGGQPTYVYPEQVKAMIRSVFPEDICDYPDPCHHQVVYVTMEDLHKLTSVKQHNA